MLGSLSRMVAAFKASDEFAELKPRTRKDYACYLDKIEMEFGHLPVAAMSAPVIKAYYKRVRREKSVTWSYHIMGSLRATMSWGVCENRLEKPGAGCGREVAAEADGQMGAGAGGDLYQKGLRVGLGLNRSHGQCVRQHRPIPNRRAVADAGERRRPADQQCPD